jgi:hypothetical protein
MTSGQARCRWRRACSSSRSTGSAALGERVAAAHRKVVDDIAVIKTVHTNAINHDPACTL